MAEISFNEQAYCKMILHAVKYPHCSVNGVLLVSSKEVKENPKKLKYVDAVPLFHLCLHVTPMIEIALTQISTYAQSNGLVIAGYYLANENLKDVSYDKPYQSRVADKIAEYFPSACLVVLDNRKLTQTMQESALLIAQSSDRKWKAVSKNSIKVEEQTLSSISTLIQRHVYRELIDFDNHLDNLAADWRNSNLNEIIEQEHQT